MKSNVLKDEMKPACWCNLVLYKAAASVGISSYC